MSNEKRPLRCAECGAPRWNDTSIRWLPEGGGEFRQPYCAATCSPIDERALDANLRLRPSHFRRVL